MASVAIIFALGSMQVTPAVAYANYNYCGAGAPDVQDGAWGNWAGPYANMHTGPRPGCNIIGGVAVGRLDYHCWVQNPETFSTWTYLELADYPGTFGWVSDGNLTNGGAAVHCP